MASRERGTIIFKMARFSIFGLKCVAKSYRTMIKVCIQWVLCNLARKGKEGNHGFNFGS
jgi:hypothetical protein